MHKKFTGIEHTTQTVDICDIPTNTVSVTRDTFKQYFPRTCTTEQNKSLQFNKVSVDQFINFLFLKNRAQNAIRNWFFCYFNMNIEVAGKIIAKSEEQIHVADLLILIPISLLPNNTYFI